MIACFHVSIKVLLNIMKKFTKLLNRSQNKICFLVIGCTPEFPSYLSALLPKDQIFDSDSDLEASPVKKKKEKEPNADSKDAIKKEGKTHST